MLVSKTESEGGPPVTLVFADSSGQRQRRAKSAADQSSRLLEELRAS